MRNHAVPRGVAEAETRRAMAEGERIATERAIHGSRATAPTVRDVFKAIQGAASCLKCGGLQGTMNGNAITGQRGFRATNDRPCTCVESADSLAELEDVPPVALGEDFPEGLV